MNRKERRDERCKGWDANSVIKEKDRKTKEVRINGKSEREKWKGENDNEMNEEIRWEATNDRKRKANLGNEEK